MAGLIGTISNESWNWSPENFSQCLSGYKELNIQKCELPEFQFYRISLPSDLNKRWFLRDENKGISLVFDGHLFDKSTLIKDYHQGDSSIECDLEIIIAHFLKYGVAGLSKLNGNFLGIIKLDKSQSTIVFNDRLGFKQHFYTYFKDSLFISPQPKVFKSIPGFSYTVNPETMFEYLALGECWSGRTLINNIKYTLPAICLKLSNNKLDESIYWKVHYESDRSLKPMELAEELAIHLKRATSERTQNHPSIGLTLSGGLDSRVVLASIPSELRDSVYAATFGPWDSHEVQIARRTINEIPIKEHLLLSSNPADLIEHAASEIDRTAGLSSIGVAFAYPVVKQLSQKTDLLLDGYAMDLSLGGSYLSRNCFKLESNQDLIGFFKSKRVFSNQEFKELMQPNFDSAMPALLDQDLENKVREITSDEPANKVDEFAFQTHIGAFHVGDITPRCFFTVQHPSGDNRFLDLILKCPPEFRFQHKLYRKMLYFLEPAVKDIPYNLTMLPPKLPIPFWRIGKNVMAVRDRLINRMRKRDIFRNVKSNRSYVDYDLWFRNDSKWQEYFRELLMNKNSRYREFLNPDVVHNILEQTIDGSYPSTKKLLLIGNVELLLRSLED